MDQHGGAKPPDARRRRGEAGGGLGARRRPRHGRHAAVRAPAWRRRQGSPGGLGRLERWASPQARGKFFLFPLFNLSFLFLFIFVLVLIKQISNHFIKC